MRIRLYRKAWYEGGFFYARKETCSCSGGGCKKPHVYGFSISVGRTVLRLSFNKPKWCEAPF